MVQQAVEQCGGDHGVAEDLAPFREAAVGGEDHGRAFVAGVDELEEEVGRCDVLAIEAGALALEETGAGRTG